MIVPLVPVSQRQTRLMVPTCGLPSMAQAVAVMIGGMKNGSVISTSSVRRYGVSVRATIQANSIASATAMRRLEQRDAERVEQDAEIRRARRRRYSRRD